MRSLTSYFGYDDHVDHPTKKQPETSDIGGEQGDSQSGCELQLESLTSSTVCHTRCFSAGSQVQCKTFFMLANCQIMRGKFNV